MDSEQFKAVEFSALILEAADRVPEIEEARVEIVDFIRDHPKISDGQLSVRVLDAVGAFHFWVVNGRQGGVFTLRFALALAERRLAA